MPSPQLPSHSMECSLFTYEEIQRAIRKTKSTSAPSPFDQIGYQIFKKCPVLLPALADLFNACWMQSTIPQQWKCAAIKLIGKASATSDATKPSNFRPIALTPCIGKLFTTILRNRWLTYMTSNGYLNSSLQKAFMPTVPGCTEHHFKLSAIMNDAQKRHRSLCICWLDIANAYGSVHHSLIQFTLQHYHPPPEFCTILKALYSGLQAKIFTKEWVTPAFPLQIGVYQGDPLSVVIFNTVMNTLVDTLQVRLDLGYHISNSKHKVNVLQYADDTCLFANSPVSCQHLLTMSSDWLQWANMKAKVPKCHCLAFKGSSSKLLNPHLSLHGMEVPYSQGPVRFLGLNVQVPRDSTNTKHNLLSSLLGMMEAIDTAPVTRK